MATKKKTETPKKSAKKEVKKDIKKEAPREEQPFMSTYGNIDSKFRFVHLASKRAKSLLKGAKPKTKAKSKSLIRLAQVEVKEGLIYYRILPSPEEEAPAKEERFVGGDGVGIGEPELETEETPDTAESEGEAGVEAEPATEFEEKLPGDFEGEKEES
jgi:DNA-directed RNA polymerase subunit K/omega